MPVPISASEDMARQSRFRDFSTMVYPESAPENWEDILRDEHIQALISPLHDNDINPTGEKKKPHYHVHIMFEGPKTKDAAIKIFDKIGGVGCEIVNSRRGMARYLTHKDNPEKAQYPDEEVVIMGGVDYWEIINLPSDKYALIGDILDFVIENRVSNIIDLFKYTRDIGAYDWYRIIIDNTYLFGSYCKAVKERKIEITEGKLLEREIKNETN